LLEMSGSSGSIGCSSLRGFRLATGDGGAAQGFDSVIEGIAGLFAEDLA
jgi:hypothetical protein